MDRPFIEETLGYSFREPSFLLQAVTHCSYAQNKATHSMERLEFLGDAVLDYLVTVHLCSSSSHHAVVVEGGDEHVRRLIAHRQPGEVTNLRSSLVNNNTLAGIAVQTGLYKQLQVAVQPNEGLFSSS